MNACDKFGHSVLMFAAESNCCQCMNFLVRAGADVNKVNLDRNSTLILCTARDGDDPHEIVNLLIQAGADVNNENKAAKTALFYTSQYGHSKSTNLLISAGADVKRHYENGNTALILAVINNHPHCVELLTKSGG